MPNDELTEVVCVAQGTYISDSTDFILCLNLNVICLIFCY